MTSIWSIWIIILSIWIIIFPIWIIIFPRLEADKLSLEQGLGDTRAKLEEQVKEILYSERYLDCTGP